MCDWIRFHPDPETNILYIELLAGGFMDIQPHTMEDADRYCVETLFPMIDKIQALCLSRGLRQVVTTNMKDMNIRKARVHVMGRISWNVYQHTKECILLDGCEISGTNPIIESLLAIFKGFLPSFIRDRFVTHSAENDEE